MKKLLFIATMLMTILVSSCKEDKNPVSPNFYSFVTAQFENGKFANMTTDGGRVLCPTNSFVPRVSDGQRFVAYYYFPDYKDIDKDNANVEIVAVDYDVELGTSKFVADEAELKALGTEGTSFFHSGFYYPTMTPKFINIYVFFNASKPEKHKFTLARVESDDNDGRILDLTLCHDNGGDTGSQDWYTWISLPVDSFKDLLDGKDRVRVNIKTRMNGIQALELMVPKDEVVKSSFDCAQPAGRASSERLSASDYSF